MQNRLGKKPVRFMLLFSAFILCFILIMQPWEILIFQKQIATLFPAGLIAIKERDLLLIIQGLMLLIVIPVYILTFVFSWRYRAHHPKEKYDPDLIDNALAEYIWWGLPTILTIIVAILTWVKTHELDPYRPIASDQKPITIQAVALQWKWLFIYPEEKIASVNYLQFPTNTPLRFEVTADAPMNSFWIPHLGGQIYAMPGMRTQLFLLANEIGDFRGSSANISGEGFANMHFIARASTEEEYRKWIEETKKASHSLNLEQYQKLATPSLERVQETFKLEEHQLFDQILMKYMPMSEGAQ